MTSNFTKEAILIALAAAVGVGTITVYQILTKGSGSLLNAGAVSETKADRVEPSTSPRLPQRSPEPSSNAQLPAAPQSPDPLDAAKERERELEKKLADANRRIAQMSQISSAESLREPGVGQTIKSDKKQDKKYNHSTQELVAKQKEKIDEVMTQVNKFMDLKSDNQWPTKGTEAWGACANLQRQQLPAEDSVKIFGLCNLLLLDGIRFINNNDGKIDSEAIITVAKSLKKEKDLLSMVQLKEIERITRAVKRSEGTAKIN